MTVANLQVSLGMIWGEGDVVPHCRVQGRVVGGRGAARRASTTRLEGPGCTKLAEEKQISQAQVA